MEFKEAKRTFDFTKLGKYFSALSNEANLKGISYAWLVFGIEDKQHKIVGSQFRSNRKKLDSVKSEIANKTTNRITFIEIHELQLPEGGVVMFQIPVAPKGIPIAFEGHYYGRDSEELGPLNLEEIERIRAQAITEDWSASIVSQATIEDLDKEESEHFINPAEAKIRWLLKDEKGNDRDYLIEGCPLILGVDKIYNKIRNLKYRYIHDGTTLFPDEVDQYEPFTIREAINNCIAHQDYVLSGKINVVELPGQLIFTNVGSFIPGSVEQVVIDNAPEEHYRNRFLATAMFNVKMVDTAGGGIRKMFNYQRARLFPLPEYDLNNNRVKVTIAGKILDMDFARILVNNKDLGLEDIILLDKVQKKKPINPEEAKHLRKKKLIEGRTPNYYLSVSVAKEMGRKADYSKNKGLDKEYYLELVKKAIKQHGSLSRKDIDDLLWNKLPDWMDDQQRKNKIKNLLSELRSNDLIKNEGTFKESKWVLK